MFENKEIHNIQKLLSPNGDVLRTIRLDFSDGDCLIAKWDLSQRETERHHRILTSLIGTQIPAPKPVGLITLQSEGGSVLLMECMPGENWYSNAGNLPVDLGRIDSAISVLTNLESLNGDELKWTRASPTPLQADVDEYAPHLRKHPLIAQEANELLASVAEIEPWESVVDHGDFGPHNLLYVGEKVTGLIDWDRAAIRDCAQVLGGVVAEVLGMPSPIEKRTELLRRLLSLYADRRGCTVQECQRRALPFALTATLDWLVYQKNAPAVIHEESLRELTSWPV